MGILEEMTNVRTDLKVMSDAVRKHEEQISGERGLSAAIDVLAEEFKNLRRTIWVTGSGIMVSIVGFGIFALRATGTA